jgi:hypothetical protein
MTKGSTCLEITFPVRNDFEGLKNGKVKLEIGTTNRRKKNWVLIFLDREISVIIHYNYFKTQILALWYDTFLHNS